MNPIAYTGSSGHWGTSALQRDLSRNSSLFNIIDNQILLSPQLDLVDPTLDIMCATVRYKINQKKFITIVRPLTIEIRQVPTGKTVLQKIKKRILKWFGKLERMEGITPFPSQHVHLLGSVPPCTFASSLHYSAIFGCFELICSSAFSRGPFMQQLLKQAQ